MEICLQKRVVGRDNWKRVVDRNLPMNLRLQLIWITSISMCQATSTHVPRMYLKSQKKPANTVKSHMKVKPMRKDATGKRKSPRSEPSYVQIQAFEDLHWHPLNSQCRPPHRRC